MKAYIRVGLLLAVMLLSCIGSRQSLAQGNSTIADIFAIDTRFSRFNTIVGAANLQPMFRGTGPYTVFAPTDEALTGLTFDNANALRRMVLYHTVQAAVDLDSFTQSTTIRTSFGKNITISAENGTLLLNGQTQIVVRSIKATNGTIHLIDRVLSADAPEPVSAETTDSTAPQPEIKPVRNPDAQVTNAPAAIENPQQLIDPSQNPSYVSGGYISYWAGIRSPSDSCKGMTWTLHNQSDGVVKVGSDRATNPYRGDTACDTALPLLCLQRDRVAQPPESNSGHDYHNGWAFGQVFYTEPIEGNRLDSRATADHICAQTFGEGTRMAEFHDGNLGQKTGSQSGHDFWAHGALPANQRFWVAIHDQPANPWNSVNPVAEPPAYDTLNIFSAGDDPAFVGFGSARLSAEIGLNATTTGCQGNTWVLHKQIDGKVQVGADHSSNPFIGDRPCTDRYPILCIQVVGWQPPTNSHNEDFSFGWSGGWVKASEAVSGKDIDTRENANAICQEQFGSAWRMAEFHDGTLGTSSSFGWEFWAYGDLPIGLRYWVAVNDQLSNPWNR